MTFDARTRIEFLFSLAPGVSQRTRFTSIEQAFSAEVAFRQGDYQALGMISQGWRVIPALTASTAAIAHEIVYRILVEAVHQVPGWRRELLATGDEPIDARMEGIPIYPALVELLRTKLRMIDEGAFIVTTWADDYLAEPVLRQLGICRG